MLRPKEHPLHKILSTQARFNHRVADRLNKVINFLNSLSQVDEKLTGIRAPKVEKGALHSALRTLDDRYNFSLDSFKSLLKKFQTYRDSNSKGSFRAFLNSPKLEEVFDESKKKLRTLFFKKIPSKNKVHDNNALKSFLENLHILEFESNIDWDIIEEFSPSKTKGKNFLNSLTSYFTSDAEYISPFLIERLMNTENSSSLLIYFGINCIETIMEKEDKSPDNEIARSSPKADRRKQHWNEYLDFCHSLFEHLQTISNQENYIPTSPEWRKYEKPFLCVSRAKGDSLPIEDFPKLQPVDSGRSSGLNSDQHSWINPESLAELEQYYPGITRYIDQESNSLILRWFPYIEDTNINSDDIVAHDENNLVAQSLTYQNLLAKAFLDIYTLISHQNISIHESQRILGEIIDVNGSYEKHKTIIDELYHLTQSNNHDQKELIKKKAALLNWSKEVIARAYLDCLITSDEGEVINVSLHPLFKVNKVFKMLRPPVRELN